MFIRPRSLSHHLVLCYNLGLQTNIFWGNPHNYYSTASITSLPAHCPYGILAADVDDDGFNDILFTRMNDVAYGDDHLAPAWLYRGGADGYTTARRYDIPVRYQAWTVHAADLNRDGHLDLTFASVDKGKQAEAAGKTGAAKILYDMAARRTKNPTLRKALQARLAKLSTAVSAK